MEIEALNWVPVIGFALVLAGIIWYLVLKPWLESYKYEAYRKTAHYCEAVDFINDRYTGALNKLLGHKVKRKDSAYRVHLLTIMDGQKKLFIVSVLDTGRGYTCTLIDSSTQ